MLRHSQPLSPVINFTVVGPKLNWPRITGGGNDAQSVCSHLDD